MFFHYLPEAMPKAEKQIAESPEWGLCSVSLTQILNSQDCRTNQSTAVRGCQTLWKQIIPSHKRHVCSNIWQYGHFDEMICYNALSYVNF